VLILDGGQNRGDQRKRLVVACGHRRSRKAVEEEVKAGMFR